jgi:hypothetical protein
MAAFTRLTSPMIAGFVLPAARAIVAFPFPTTSWGAKRMSVLFFFGAGASLAPAAGAVLFGAGVSLLVGALDAPLLGGLALLVLMACSGVGLLVAEAVGSAGLLLLVFMSCSVLVDESLADAVGTPLPLASFEASFMGCSGLGFASWLRSGLHSASQSREAAIAKAMPKASMK